MKTYLSLQCKRVLKVLPYILAVTVILFAGLVVALSALISNYMNSEENTVFVIGITGDVDNDYIKLALAAVQTFDETRFSIEFVTMDEDDAKEQLSDGTLTAYVVMPEDFVENAIAGNVEPLRYVTTSGTNGISTIFKNEMTKIITDMVVNAQKGSYGIYDAAVQNGEINKSDLQTQISFDYVELIIKRTDMLSIEELGISNGLTMVEYYICGIAILFLMLLGLPFVAVYIRKDNALNALLLSKGFSNLKQILCEWTAHFFALVTLTLTVFVLAFICSSVFPMPEDIPLPDSSELLVFSGSLIGILIMFSAFNLMVFELSQNIVSGVLIHFFTTLSLCYISGCFYPVYSFPKIIQSIERFLPTGVARTNLASAFVDEFNTTAMLATLGFGILFCIAAVYLRTQKNQTRRELR